ncbi:MAG: hypothetical protein ACRDZO_28845 [Egibacteraceae bacterium]
MVARTQITLDPEDHRRARTRAEQLGISFAEYVRRLIAKDLERPSPTMDPSVVFDLGASHSSDVARHKDDYVAAAVQVQHNAERA